MAIMANAASGGKKAIHIRVTLLAKGWPQSYKFSIPFSFLTARLACFPLFSFL